MTARKKLSNPVSTGGGGVNFEAQVQAFFVTLMLTNGYAPCLPEWPITKINLQGKIDDYATDDLIVFVKNPNGNEQRKLLVQVKRSIKITKSDAVFGGVMSDAWNDFNNPNVFTKGKDAIALITGPINTAGEAVIWLCEHARANPDDPGRFFKNVNTPNFCSNEKRKKLEVLRHHLKTANNNNSITDETFHQFLKSFYLLNYDFGENGVVSSLIKSNISQSSQKSPEDLWSRILKFTSNVNQHAGSITQSNMPNDLKREFITHSNWVQHPDALYLALMILIGNWNENNKDDTEAITKLLEIEHKDWQLKALNILHSSDSPLSLSNGIWKIVNKAELWAQLGSYITDHKLNLFKSIAVNVLKEHDPAFELPTNERYAANIYGKVLEHSRELREGIAEGLAILGSKPEVCSYTSNGMAETTSILSIREIFTDADWITWGSLNDLLPDLAEAAPAEFLKAVEDALHLTSCPFDKLFDEESNGITGRTYLTGLLWALERLAWDERYLVRVCVVLGELASHDPGGKWLNRPANSLTTILMPWRPRTLAPINKRKAAMQALLKEQPDVGLNLIIQLLPGQHQSSLGSDKPKWRNPVPEDWEENVTNKDYLQQTSSYANLAVSAAKYDIARLSKLVDKFNNLPKDAFDQLIKTLNSQVISDLPEDQRLVLWEHLTQFTHRHRRYSDAGWALSDKLITRIEQIADKLAPTDLCNLYRRLFTDNDFDLYNGNDNWEEQRVKLNTRRRKTVAEIFQQHGIKGVIQFAESVVSPGLVGYALGNITDKVIEQTIVPDFLNAENNNHKNLVANFIWRRFQINSWEWCDGIDKSKWTPEQIRVFLTYLPFIKEAWDRASQWLGKDQGTYWSSVYANPYHQDDEDLTVAIEKLLEYNRPLAAIDCLYKMGTGKKQTINIALCVRALLAAPSSSEPVNSMDSYRIVELIKFLQSKSSVTKENLFQIEWAYLPLLDDRPRGTRPKLLEAGLASNPKLFCEVIQLLYKSQNVNQPLKEHSEESNSRWANAWRLLSEWQTPPGSQDDGTLNPEQFDAWLQHVKIICKESGHLEVALDHIGKVLIHAPDDPSGLWIHQAVADALNGYDVESMRDGFRMGILNSRGVRVVDPTGKPEKELAEKYYIRADEVENAGFHRLAATLKDLAHSYKREAEKIIDEHLQDDKD